MEGHRSKRSHSKQSASQLSSSRSSKHSIGLHSSSQFRLRSSQSFLGSRSSLASLSKRNLASDSSRFQKPEAQIYDEHGEDITPRPLLNPDLYKKTSNKTFWNNDNTSTDSIFHHSGASGSSFSQPFSASVMEGGSVTESSSSMSMFGSSLGHTKHEPPIKKDISSEAVNEDGKEEEGREKGREEEGREKGKDDVIIRGDDDDLMTITLSETETITLLSIPGSVVLDPEQQQDVQNSNHKYKELLSNCQGNDRYSARGMQTINNARKTKHVQTDPVQITSSGVYVSTADMYDTYYHSTHTSNDVGQDASIEELSSRAVSRLAAGTSGQPSQPTTVLDNTSTSAIPGESTFVASVFTQSSAGLINHSSSRGLPNQSPVIDPTQPNNHPILKSVGLPDRLRIVETAVIMNSMQNRLAIYRNLPTLIEHIPSSVDNLTIARGHLDKLWVYYCPLLRRRIVTAITWNLHNMDIVAVSYGGFNDKDAVQGIVCCWSLKNTEYPARVYHATSGVISLCFSYIHPNLLAAGLYNGSVVLYDVRSTQHISVLDSRDAIHQHCGPVWQVKWVLKEKTLGEEARSETLVSTCTDGRVLQWSIRKGFESSVLMKLKRVVFPKPPHVKKQNKDRNKQVTPQTTTDTIISQHAPGLGFDFNPTDSNIYLVCTEEGLIHKCSCSYNEQVLETYKGHTGAVYRVRWSPFVSDVFISCSSDWSVKLWHHEHTTPLHTFSSTKTPIYEVVWSPFHSAMFGCVSDGSVEVWNLDMNMLDPVIHQSPKSTPTCLSFSSNSQTLLVGVASGEVGVYQLKNVSQTADKEVLLTIIQDTLKELHK